MSRLVARSTVEEYMVDKARGKLVINHMVFSSLDERQKGGTGAKAGEVDEILKYGARRLFEEDEKAGERCIIDQTPSGVEMKHREDHQDAHQR